jgi:predicted DNA binding protein
MVEAKLRLTVPDDLWIGRVSRAHPGAQFRVLSALADEESGVALVEVTADALDAVVDALAAAPPVGELTELRREADTALVQLETSAPALLFPVQSSGVPLELPFELADGEAVWEVTTSEGRLSTLGEQLSAFGIEFTVEYVRRGTPVQQLLTDHQQRLLATALVAGYYDTPRTCTLTELADRMGVAKSTCSETLHRAESKVLTRFVEEYLGDVEPVDGDGDRVGTTDDDRE